MGWDGMGWDGMGGLSDGWACDHAFCIRESWMEMFWTCCAEWHAVQCNSPSLARRAFSLRRAAAEDYRGLRGTDQTKDKKGNTKLSCYAPVQFLLLSALACVIHCLLSALRDECGVALN